MEDAFCNLTDEELNDIEIIETLRFDPSDGFVRGDLHLARMARSAAAFDFTFSLEAAKATLAPITSAEPLRVRLSLNRASRFAVSSVALAPNPASWNFAIAIERLDAANPWLRHKTTRRAVYNRHRAELPLGLDEIIFCNLSGDLCEGTITNLFVQKRGALLTPPLASGLLPGVLREQLIAEGKAREAKLMPGDLVNAEAIFLGNSLRGLIAAKLI
ncbi:MAG: aminotransferase class IV family protein [Aestuariivirga sp.]